VLEQSKIHYYRGNIFLYNAWKILRFSQNMFAIHVPLHATAAVTGAEFLLAGMPAPRKHKGAL
jgi:hypothetical protein